MHTLSLRGKFKFVLDEEFRFVYPLHRRHHHCTTVGRSPFRSVTATKIPAHRRGRTSRSVCVCVCGGRKYARPILQDDYIQSYIILLYAHTHRHTHTLSLESRYARAPARVYVYSDLNQ